MDTPTKPEAPRKITYFCNSCGEEIRRKEKEPSPKTCPFCKSSRITALGYDD